MQSDRRLPSRSFASRSALFLTKRVLPVVAFACLAAGCDVGNKPEPPYKDPPPNQRIKSQKPVLLVQQYQCGSCHEIPQVPAARGGIGPSLAGFGRRSYIAGEIPSSHEALARWLVAPDSLVPGTAMPAMGVAPQDAHDIAAWLLTLT